MQYCIVTTLELREKKKKKEGVFDSKYTKNPEDGLTQSKERLRVILVGGGQGQDLGQ